MLADLRQTIYDDSWGNWEALVMTGGNRKLLALPSLVLLALFLANAAWPAPAESPKARPSPAATGQLNIEGEHIERITLERKAARNPFDPESMVVLHRPGPSVSVPAGEYWLQKVELAGGYSCFLPRRIGDGLTGEVRDGEWLNIRPEKPCSLKIGGPLKSTVLTHRQGPTVLFAYQLLDGNGRMYFRENAGKPPQFAIYCDNRLVGSGSFEYG